MKKILIYLPIISLILLSFKSDQFVYDPSLVEISSMRVGNDEFVTVVMQREGARIKAKYFASKDFTGTSVFERYKAWSRGKKIVAITSGTYMDDCSIDRAKPVGICIDNGIEVNKTIRNDLGALVTVYATGGIVATKLDDRDFTVNWKGESKTLDIKYNSWHRQEFFAWAKDQMATVFQAHLLVYKDKLNTSHCNTPECLRKADRRFLAVGRDDNNKLVHVIIHSKTETTLYMGAKKTYDFLKARKMNDIVYMINLDTGCQNVFFLYNSNGHLHPKAIGTNMVHEAVNLLVYYYE